MSKRIEDILMKRDGMSREDAREIINETREAMEDAMLADDYTLAEEIFTSDLGLEIDYIFDILCL